MSSLMLWILTQEIVAAIITAVFAIKAGLQDLHASLLEIQKNQLAQMILQQRDEDG